MATGLVTTSEDDRILRWDLLEGLPPSGERLTARPAVPSRSADVLIAVDAARHRFLLVRIPDGEPSLIAERASRGISVQTVELTLDAANHGVFVEVACLEQAGYAALDTVAIEIVEALVAGASIGRLRLVQSVLTKWRRFWSGISQGVLSREQHLGLFGELWFLSRWLVPCIGLERAVPMWRGPVGARNDFEQPGWAIEAKTSGKLDGSHQVHGLEQLLAPPGIDLLLFSILVRDEASGVETLGKLVGEIRASLSLDHALLSQFEAMLAAAGFEDVHASEYEKVKLRIRGQGLYRVDDGFPRLIPSSILSGVPPGVTNVTYELRLDAAGRWLVGDSPAGAKELLQELSHKAANVS